MYKKKSLSNFILLALEKSINGYVKFEDFVYHPPGFYDYRMGNEPKKSELAQVFKRLRENGFVELISDDQLVFRLTNKGKEKAILASLSTPDKSWDGRWRVVIFDIPEKRRLARDLLRRKLKDWGFEPFQKSVWASKKNCTIPLRRFIKQIGIEDWVMVMESDDIGR